MRATKVTRELHEQRRARVKDRHQPLRIAAEHDLLKLGQFLERGADEPAANGIDHALGGRAPRPCSRVGRPAPAPRRPLRRSHRGSECRPSSRAPAATGRTMGSLGSPDHQARPISECQAFRHTRHRESRSRQSRARRTHPGVPAGRSGQRRRSREPRQGERVEAHGPGWGSSSRARCPRSPGPWLPTGAATGDAPVRGRPCGSGRASRPTPRCRRASTSPASRTSW